jgi:hypothetical protein
VDLNEEVVADGALACVEPAGLPVAATPHRLCAPDGGEALAWLDPASGEIVPPSTNPLLVRRWLIDLTDRMLATPGAQRELEVKHTFLDGMYMRELFIPKGTLLVGKIHKQPCMNLVSKGDISVLTESGSARVKAGYSVVSPAGIQKLGYAHEDTVFVNVFRTDETDPQRIEQVIAWDSYEQAAISHATAALQGDTACQ